VGEGVVSSHTHTIWSKSSSSLLYWRSVIDIETFSDSNRWRGYVAQPLSRPVSSGVYNPVDHIPRPHHSHRRLPSRTLHGLQRVQKSRIVRLWLPSSILSHCCCCYYFRRHTYPSQHSKSRPTSNPTNSSATWTWVTYQYK